MKDSDIICRLIYCAWIGPVPEQGDFDEFRAVLDCFARAVERENRQEQMQNIPIRPVTLTPERLLEIVKENTDQAGDRQTDGAAGTSDGGDSRPATFAGYAAGEKRAIHERLTTFVKARYRGSEQRRFDARRRRGYDGCEARAAEQVESGSSCAGLDRRAGAIQRRMI